MAQEQKEVILITTHYECKQTLGLLLVIQGTQMIFKCVTLEPPWKNNAPRISCIPGGIYDLVFERSPKFKRDLYELKGVPDRSEVKIHNGVYYWNTEGCIIIGDMFKDLNSDGFRDVRNSVPTLDRFHEAMGGVKVSRIKVIR